MEAFGVQLDDDSLLAFFAMVMQGAFACARVGVRMFGCVHVHQA
jgi:hypothetical protein